jgi:hypothetical protein
MTRTFTLMAGIAVTLATAAFGESPYEREMKSLRDRRDKALAESKKALDAQYQTALEQVYRRALQANDASAPAIKAELETLGPLREKPATPAVPPNAASLPRTMLGVWKVVKIGDWRETWDFKADGTCGITAGTAKAPGTACTWSKVKDTIEVTFPGGNITALELPIKNGKLEGTDHKGGRLWLTKDK